MSHRRDLLNAAALSVLPAASLSWAQTPGPVTLAGVKFEPEITLGGRKLQLNGAGIRYRAVFKVYAAGFYTASKVTKNEEALKTDAPKRMQLVALRTVTGEEFGKLFSRAMENNASREEFTKSVSSVIRMGQMFADARQFTERDVILIDYVPGTGTIISHRGKQMGDVFKEPEFQSLMMKIWFGPKPVDEPLRIALLGGQSTANS